MKANGALFKNDRKTGAQPDYRGRLTVTADIMREWQALMGSKQEVVFDLAGWIKTSPKGVGYMSLTCSPPFDKGNAPPAQRETKDADDW